MNGFRRRGWLKVVVTVLAVSPWVAINVYWIRIGELRSPVWLILINVLIAFLAFAGPALDRRFSTGRSDEDPTLPRTTRPRSSHRKAA